MVYILVSFLDDFLDIYFIFLTFWENHEMQYGESKMVDLTTYHVVVWLKEN